MSSQTTYLNIFSPQKKYNMAQLDDFTGAQKNGLGPQGWAKKAFYQIGVPQHPGKEKLSDENM